MGGSHVLPEMSLIVFPLIALHCKEVSTVAMRGQRTMIYIHFMLIDRIEHKSIFHPNRWPLCGTENAQTLILRHWPHLQPMQATPLLTASHRILSSVARLLVLQTPKKLKDFQPKNSRIFGQKTQAKSRKNSSSNSQKNANNSSWVELPKKSPINKPVIVQFFLFIITSFTLP